MKGLTDKLDLVQRWLQTVITHSGGVEEGIRSSEGQELIRLVPGEAEKVIQRSVSLTSLERLSIYSNAYYARLLECIGSYFPVLKRALGDKTFDSFAIEYLQRYPSQSYTLDRLGEHFGRFLLETRPDREGGTDNEDWPEFLIDLATLEWTITRVFDGPGVEGNDLLTPEILQAFPANRFAEARLLPVVCLRLLTFHYPVNSYYTAVKRAGEKEIAPIPEPMIEHVAVLRRDFIVRRYSLTDVQFAVLQEIEHGARLGEAISVAAAMMDLDDNSLAAALQSWFRTWSAAGFFAAIS